MCASFFLPTQFCNWNFKMYFWLRVQKSLIELFFCIIVKYIFHFPIALPFFLHSKYKKSCWKQLNLALKHKLCFHNTFCPAKQLVVRHFKFYCEYSIEEYLALAKDVIPLQQCGVIWLTKQELPGESIWKLIASMYWQHWSLKVSPKWLFSSREIQLFLSAENMSKCYFGKKLLTFSFTACKISVTALVRSPPINLSCETLSNSWIG